MNGERHQAEGLRPFDGQVVVLTGAAGGIGQAVARQFSGRGGYVVLVDRDAERTHALADELGGQAEALVMDLMHPNAATVIVDSVLDKHGRVDVLINNAGTSDHGPMVDVAREVLEQEIAVHLTVPFLLIQRVARPMIDAAYGRIVKHQFGGQPDRPLGPLALRRGKVGTQRRHPCSRD